MRIAIDVMGTDYGPQEIILGALDAVKKFDCEVVLVGAEAVIKEWLQKYNALDNKKIVIKNATQVIGMEEQPALAVRNKKDASIVVASKMLRSKECDALVSAGSTGAASVAAVLCVGRIKGVERPAIATAIPNLKGSTTVVLDSGSIVDAKPQNLVHSAIMGSVYAEKILHIAKPKVGLLSVGEEETKGNEQTLATYPLLKVTKEIAFIGNVEGRDIPTGKVDVVVCDGFVGNIVLKFAEGFAKSLLTMIKDAILSGGFLAKLGGLLIKPAMAKLKKRMDPAEYGGALLLGIKAPFIICHGSSKAKAITNAVGVAIEFAKNNVVDIISEKIVEAEKRNEELEQ